MKNIFILIIFLAVGLSEHLLNKDKVTGGNNYFVPAVQKRILTIGINKGDVFLNGKLSASLDQKLSPYFLLRLYKRAPQLK